jgi:hypothetical protein
MTLHLLVTPRRASFDTAAGGRDGSASVDGTSTTIIDTFRSFGRKEKIRGTRLGRGAAPNHR